MRVENEHGLRGINRNWPVGYNRILQSSAIIHGDIVEVRNLNKLLIIIIMKFAVRSQVMTVIVPAGWIAGFRDVLVGPGVLAIVATVVLEFPPTINQVDKVCSLDSARSSKGLAATKNNLILDLGQSNTISLFPTNPYADARHSFMTCRAL